MTKKDTGFALMIVLIVTLACNLGKPALTESPVVTSPNTPTSEVIATQTATVAPRGTFKLAVLVDTSSELVTRDQAEVLITESSNILLGLTDFRFEMIDFREYSGGGPIDSIVQAYYSSAPAELPNGIIIFSFGDDGRAKTFGGYAFAQAGPAGFVNKFVSPYKNPDDMYIGVVHFGHRFGKCGYGDSDTPISSVSVDGECRNQPGTACVEKYGYQMCSILVDELYASTPTYMASSTFVHEIMHPFGKFGAQDHYFTAECTEVMKSGVSARQYQADSFDSDESNYYVNMCPYVFDNFVNSYRP